MSYYKTCPFCGAHLDSGERCDCQDIKEAAPGAGNTEDGKAKQIDKPVSASIINENKEDFKMLRFPVAADDFIAYQENGINRKLDDLERKLADAVVDLANGSYQEGVDGKENSITIEMVKEFLRLRGKEEDKKLLRILESICRWCDKAYGQGKEAAQHD